MATIPYDPSIVLGNIVPPKKLENLMQLAETQNKIDSQKSAMNELILQRRNLGMAATEIMNLGGDTADLQKSIDEITKTLTKAAADYGTAIATNTPELIKLKAKILGISENIESPIDYTQTQIKKMPLAADSLRMDSQYFHKESNTQTEDDMASRISAYVSEQTKGFGSDHSSAMAASAHHQTSSQYKRHAIMGTLVITCTCTHKNAVLLSPLKMDVDKAIRVWNNTLNVGSKPRQALTPTSAEDMQKVLSADNSAEPNPLYIVSGATYGSSFVAMIHIRNVSSTTTNQSLTSIAASIKEQAKMSLFISSEKGGFGVDSSFSDNMKAMLSQQEVTSHINVVCMGVLPSVKANTLNFAVSQFADLDPQKTMNALDTLNSKTGSAQESITSAATPAKAGQQFGSMQKIQVQNVMSSVSKIDNESNRVFDINSLMTAFDDYLTKIQGDGVGVPINYYLKPITAKQLAQMWIRKYLPTTQFLGVKPITDDGKNDSSSGDGK